MLVVNDTVASRLPEKDLAMWDKLYYYLHIAGYRKGAAHIALNTTPRKFHLKLKDATVYNNNVANIKALTAALKEGLTCGLYPKPYASDYEASDQLKQDLNNYLSTHKE